MPVSEPRQTEPVPTPGIVAATTALELVPGEGPVAATLVAPHD
jgi:hypothetical protein